MKNKKTKPQTPSAWGDGLVDGEWEYPKSPPEEKLEPEQIREPETKSALSAIRQYWDPSTENPLTKPDPTRGEIA